MDRQASKLQRKGLEGVACAEGKRGKESKQDRGAGMCLEER